MRVLIGKSERIHNKLMTWQPPIGSLKIESHGQKRLQNHAALMGPIGQNLVNSLTKMRPNGLLITQSEMVSKVEKV